MVELRGLKPRTSALPALRSNQLSYSPNYMAHIVKGFASGTQLTFGEPAVSRLAAQLHRKAALRPADERVSPGPQRCQRCALIN